jgi:hypothetical protein
LRTEKNQRRFAPTKTGRLAPEWVAAFLRNQWPESPEYAAEAIASQSLIIEDYPDDKYGPSCLVFGVTEAGRPLHIQCSYPARPLVKIITTYEPDKDLWIDYKIRRK